MAFSEAYRRQVELLVRVLPIVAGERCFALKGGTAINLFVRDMPRLSVDIDLTYLPVAPRDESLRDMEAALRRIGGRVAQSVGGAKIIEQTHREGRLARLLVRTVQAQIKVEVTPVLRGCVFQPETRRVSAVVEDAFGFAEMQIVSWSDLYAGKIVAALDRQHPRDLFDVHGLLENEGIDDRLRAAFIVYLLSHNRPMWEVLACVRKDIRMEFARGFEGMTEQPVARDDLVAARENLVQTVIGAMPNEHRRFLVSFEQGSPDWAVLGLANVADLPAVKWRMENLEKLTTVDRRKLVVNLERTLAISGG